MWEYLSPTFKVKHTHTHNTTAFTPSIWSKISHCHITLQKVSKISIHHIYLSFVHKSVHIFFSGCIAGEENVIRKEDNSGGKQILLSLLFLFIFFFLLFFVLMVQKLQPDVSVSKRGVVSSGLSSLLSSKPISWPWNCADPSVAVVVFQLVHCPTWWCAQVHVDSKARIKTWKWKGTRHSHWWLLWNWARLVSSAYFRSFTEGSLECRTLVYRANRAQYTSQWCTDKWVPHLTCWWKTDWRSCWGSFVCRWN